MIGLNRVKDFLLLIIIMKSSEILTNSVYKRRHNLSSELENGKITRKPSLFLPSSIFVLRKHFATFISSRKMTLTLSRPGFVLLPATGRPSGGPPL